MSAGYLHLFRSAIQFYSGERSKNRLLLKSGGAFAGAQIGHSRSGVTKAVHNGLSADGVSGAALSGRGSRGDGSWQITGRFSWNLTWVDGRLHGWLHAGCDGWSGSWSHCGCCRRCSTWRG